MSSALRLGVWAALLACGVAGARTPAHAESWRGELSTGLGITSSGGRMSDLAGAGAGLDLHVSAFPPRSWVGLRVQGGLSTLEEKSFESTGYLLWFPITETLWTGHTIAWFGAGPECSLPVGKGRASFYCLLGRATVSPSTRGGSVNLTEDSFPSSDTPVVVLGAAVRTPPLDLHRLGHGSLEFGVEHLSGGECTFYGDPPIVPAGDAYVIQTERASLSTVAFRAGLAWEFPSR